MSVNVELGDHVKKGQVLATIRSTELAEVQKDVSDARTDLVVAQNNLRVAKEMYEGKLNTERDVLEAKSQLQKAQDQMQRASAVSTVYNVKKGNIYSVVAPISGYIVQKISIKICSSEVTEAKISLMWPIQRMSGPL